jgi:hypothetical protein
MKFIFFILVSFFVIKLLLLRDGNFIYFIFLQKKKRIGYVYVFIFNISLMIIDHVNKKKDYKSENK